MNKTVGLFWRACSFSLAVNFRLNDCDRHEAASSELSTDSVSPPSSSFGVEGRRISSGWHLNESVSRNFFPSLIFDILQRENGTLTWEFKFIHKSVTVIGYIFPPLLLWLLIGHWRRKPSFPAPHALPGKLEQVLSFENMASSNNTCGVEIPWSSTRNFFICITKLHLGYFLMQFMTLYFGVHVYCIWKYVAKWAPLCHQSCVLFSFPFLVLHEYCSGHEVEKL